MIGDKSRHINTGLDEADTATYVCTCGFEKEVAEEYDLASRHFYPVSMASTICEKCSNYMDRKAEVVESVRCAA